MTDYSSHRHKRPGRKVSENSPNATSDGGISDSSAQPDGDEAAASTPPKADDSGADSGPPGTAGEASDETDADDEPDTSEAWKDHGYPERPKWAPECPSCGGPVIGFSVSGPMTSKIAPCGCEVPPDLVDI